MGYRGGPSTVEDHITLIEERLRNLPKQLGVLSESALVSVEVNSRIIGDARTLDFVGDGVSITGIERGEDLIQIVISGGGGHTHDDPAHIAAAILGGTAEGDPGRALAADYGVALGDYAQAGYVSIAGGYAAFAGDPTDNGTNYYGNVVFDPFNIANDPGTYDLQGGSGYQVVSVGTQNTVWNGNQDVLIGTDNVIGNADGSVSGGKNVAIGDNVQLEDIAGTYSVGTTVALGDDSAVVRFDNAFYDFSSLPNNASGIFTLGGASIWGQKIIYISPQGFSGDAYGTKIINIGWDNFIDRGSGSSPFVYGPLNKAIAIGTDIYPEGDEAAGFGFAVGTNRSQNLIIGDGFGGFATTLFSHLELAGEARHPVSTTTLHPDSFDGPVCNVDLSAAGGNIVFQLGAIFGVAPDDSILLDAADTAPDYGYYTGRYKGTFLYIRKDDSSANQLVVTATAPDTIEGAASVALTNQYDSITLIAGYTPTGSPRPRVWYKVAARIGGVPA